jgi:hypothetical protein
MGNGDDGAISPGPQQPDGGHSANANGSAVTGDCSHGAATRQLSQRDLLPQRSNFSGAGQVICHDFTGDGLKDLAFVRNVDGSAGSIGWGILVQRAEGGWKLATFRPQGSVMLARSGDDLGRAEETYRPGDPHCCPSGNVIVERYRYDRHARDFRRRGLVHRPITRADFRHGLVPVLRHALTRGSNRARVAFPPLLPG